MALKRLWVSGMLVLCCAFGPDLTRTHAQAKDENSEYVTVNGWAVHGYAAGKEIGYGWYETKEEALAEKAKMEKVETTTGKYYDKVELQPEPRTILKKVQGSETKLDNAKELLERLKEAKEAVDRAKKIDEGDESILKAEERKLGDTIKEYKDMLERALSQLTEAKETLSSGVKSVNDAKFKEVNQLIDKYNRDVGAFQSVMGKNYSSGLNPIPRVQLPDPKEKAKPKTEEPEIVGTWIAGGDTEWSFQQGGTFQIVGTRNRGQWKRTGDGIAVRYSGATVWINLKLAGGALVDEDGYIGHAQLKESAD